MRKLLFLLLMLWGSAELCAQNPRLAYMIPDIGTPGMNTYVEFIAEHDAIGTFGADNTDDNVNAMIYLNNPGDRIRVKCTNPLDTNKVIIGPLVVSHEGRMIATQLFIHPDMKKPSLYPNSWDWSQLRREFRIPIHVEIDGKASRPDTFYIVRPFDVDPRSINERVLGQGLLGKRSPRGAMLIGASDPKQDLYNVFFGSGTYTVSTNDCDPFRDGNQGYLPFTLLVKGVVTGDVLNGGTILSVDASGKNGGVGGGGGGGSFCDAPSNLGQPGGEGYTAGGRGGRNNSGLPLVNSLYTAYSIGSGSAIGASLNNVQPGITNAYENAGGGTGYPFGTSGVGWNGIVIPGGGFGGGSGAGQNARGGGGGFATDGEGVNETGGKNVGNQPIVPMAGGSGGAGGNPNLPANCSGIGGGGGGAIRLYAYQISRLQITAKGADGSNNFPEGGSGSGGSITLCSETAIDNVTTDVTGGGIGNNTIPDGGEGRVRYDAETNNSVPTGTSVYRGPQSTRFKSKVQRGSFVYQGTNNAIQTYTRNYFKPFGKPWSDDKVNENPQGSGSTWSNTVNLNDRNAYPETLYFLVTTQSNVGYVKTGFTAAPARIMSQAAAKIVEIDEGPVAICQDTAQFDSILCPQDYKQIQGKVWNEGGADLRILSSSFQLGTQGFSVVSIDKTTIPPNDTARITFAWQAPANSKALNFEDNFLIKTNDPDPTRETITMKLMLHRDTLDIALVENIAALQPIDTINFGTVCSNSPQTKVIYYRNNSSVEIRPTTFFVSDKANIDVSYTVPQPFLPGVAMPITITYTAKSKGDIMSSLIISARECSAQDTVIILAKGIETQLDFSGTGQFNDVRVGEKAIITVSLTNNGTANANLPANFFPINTPFRIVSTSPPLPVVLQPNQTVFIDIEYAPTLERKDSAVLSIESLTSVQSCIDTAAMLLSGNGYISNVITSVASLQFGNVARCDTKTDTIRLINKGGNIVRLDSVAIITGIHPQGFTIIQQPPIPTDINSNDSVTYIVKFNPNNGVQGLNSAIIVMFTNDKDFPIIQRPISAVREKLQTSLPTLITLPDGIVGDNALGTITIQDSQNSSLSIADIVSQLSTVTPKNFVVPSGGSRQISISLPLTKAGVIRDTLFVIFNQPCADTQRVIVEVIGRLASATQNTFINFGTVEFCETKQDSVIIANTGDVPVQIESMDIQGVEENFFRFVNSMTFPAIINPQETLTREIEFIPTATIDGAKKAEVISQIKVAAGTVPYITELHGERRSPLLASPDNPTLRVEEQSRLTQRFTLRNNGTVAVTITDVSIENAPFDLRIVPNAPITLPTQILPSEEIAFSIIFTPTSVYAEQRNIRVEYGLSSCTEIKKVALNVESIPTIRTIIYLPRDTSLNPRTVEYSIPLTMSVTPVNSELTNVSFSAEILIDERMFFPKRVTKGSLQIIPPDKSKSRRNKLIIEGDGITVSNSSPLITEIIGDAILGSIEGDSILWGTSAFRWTRGTAARVDSTVDGLLSLTLCEEGGKRLLYDSVFLTQGITILPNPPVHQATTIEVSDAELGSYSLEIYAVNGEKIFMQQWENTQVHTSRKTIALSLSSVESGYYTIVYRKPSGFEYSSFLHYR